MPTHSTSSIHFHAWFACSIQSELQHSRCFTNSNGLQLAVLNWYPGPWIRSYLLLTCAKDQKGKICQMLRKALFATLPIILFCHRIKQNAIKRILMSFYLCYQQIVATHSINFPEYNSWPHKCSKSGIIRKTQEAADLLPIVRCLAISVQQLRWSVSLRFRKTHTEANKCVYVCLVYLVSHDIRILSAGLSLSPPPNMNENIMYRHKKWICVHVSILL